MSGNRLFGRKRQEVINRWLNGEEDDIWEVKPTVSEGKYIVSKRKKEKVSKKQDVVEENVEQPLEEEPQIEQPTEEELQDETPVEPKKVKKEKPKPRVAFNNSSATDLQLEILNQLKLMGEENQKEKERKAQKKLMQDALRKELARNPYAMYCGGYNGVHQPVYLQREDSEEEPEPQYVETPRYTRRRLNLLNQYM